MMSASRRKPAAGPAKSGASIPRPFKEIPESLQGFCAALPQEHVYIAHIDYKPWAFKRKIFIVPVLMNVAVAVLFLWRLRYIGPYYFKLLASILGFSDETVAVAADSTRIQLLIIILRRALSFLLDFTLVIFVWPWPYEFCFGRQRGSPVLWRWHVGFRDREIYVRRSRDWDRSLGDVLADREGRDVLLSQVRKATSPALLSDKTGYLTMSGDWDLDWAAMVHATALTDAKAVALEAFRTLVLLHHRTHGWLCLDLRSDEEGELDDRRRQVLAFRDALTAAGKEDLFFRWVEIVQFESTQPGGLARERKGEIASRVRDLFAAEGIDFDQFWKDKVGPIGVYDF